MRVICFLVVLFVFVYANVVYAGGESYYRLPIHIMSKEKFEKLSIKYDNFGFFEKQIDGMPNFIEYSKNENYMMSFLYDFPKTRRVYGYHHHLLDNKHLMSDLEKDIVITFISIVFEDKELSKNLFDKIYRNYLDEFEKQMMLCKLSVCYIRTNYDTDNLEFHIEAYISKDNNGNITDHSGLQYLYISNKNRLKKFDWDKIYNRII